MQPTHLPGGISTDRSGPLKDFPLPDPAKWNVYFDDFHNFTASDWVITTTEAGSGAATEAISDLDGGLLEIANDNADNDADFLQNVGETFHFELGKKLIFRISIRGSDTNLSDIVAGLQVRDTTPLDTTAGVFFIKNSGDTSYDFVVEVSNNQSIAEAIVTAENHTLYELAFVYDGASRVEYFVGGVFQGALDTTNMPFDQGLALTFGIQNGSAATKRLYIDHIFIAKER